MKLQILILTFFCAKLAFCGLRNENSVKWKRSAYNLEEICGKSSFNPGLQSLISNGQTVTSEQWPWMAALFHGSVAICGGTIGKKLGISLIQSFLRFQNVLATSFSNRLKAI